MSIPMITAHSGCLDIKTNMLTYIEDSIRLGADIIELDIRPTKDNVAILVHDEGIMTKDSGLLSFFDISYKDLIDYEEARNITTLEEALEFSKNYNHTINLDMKAFESIEPTVKIVREKKMEDRVIFSGCKHKEALYFRDNYPGLSVLFNVGFEEAKFINNEYREFSRYIRSMQCCGINIEHKHCTKELVEYAKLRFLPVAIWTVDSEKDMIKGMELGVDSITTNDVNKLYKLRKEKYKL